MLPFVAFNLTVTFLALLVAFFDEAFELFFAFVFLTLELLADEAADELAAVAVPPKISIDYFFLGFFAGENEFHSCTANQIVAPPDLGFLFPAFDDRQPNIMET